MPYAILNVRMCRIHFSIETTISPAYARNRAETYQGDSVRDCFDTARARYDPQIGCPTAFAEQVGIGTAQSKTKDKNASEFRRRRASTKSQPSTPARRKTSTATLELSEEEK